MRKEASRKARARRKAAGGRRDAARLLDSADLRRLVTGVYQVLPMSLEVGAAYWGKWADAASRFQQAVLERSRNALREPRRGDATADLIDAGRRYLAQVAELPGLAAMDWTERLERSLRQEPDRPHPDPVDRLSVALARVEETLGAVRLQHGRLAPEQRESLEALRRAIDTTVARRAQARRRARRARANEVR